MRPVILALAALAALALAACDPEEELRRLPPSTPLPEIPADLKRCLKGTPVALPNRPLTVGDVERLWKSDRVRIVAMSKCGDRLVAFVERLRRS